MRHLLTTVASFMLTISLFAQSTFDIHPTPQSLKIISGGYVNIQSISPHGDEKAVSDFCAITGSKVAKKAIPTYIGTLEDRWSKEYINRLKQAKDAYYIKVTNNAVVVLGYDDRGLSYALSAIEKLLTKNNELPKIELSDYPDIEQRGVVEGFYGDPWSHEDRLSLLDFFGKNKLNVYIYGPKDDAYHSSPNWRSPYPADMATKITELAAAAKKNNVDFVWAIHPGLDIQWNNIDRDLIIKKFDMMYDLGVRSYAVFFDDISGVGTDPNRQAELLNYIHDNFITLKEDCKPLIMCPTQYNKNWSDPKPGTYLDILGDKLYQSIKIMWTGDSVISDITVDGLNHINKRIKRDAYIWWNFPVSDYVRNHLLLGSSHGLDTKAKGLMSGFVTNPMDKAEASKVAIYSVAEYSWNTDQYDGEKEWIEGIKDVMPTSYEAYTTFATHNSDPGVNYHLYRRKESENMKKYVDEFYKSKETKDFGTLKAEFLNMAAAPAIIRQKNDNPNLIKEISPWLDYFVALGESGAVAIDIVNSTNDTPNSWEQMCKLLELREEQKYIDKNNNRNPYQPGIKGGSLVMQPFVDTLTANISTNILNSVGITATSYKAAVPEFITDIAQISKNGIKQDGDKIFVSPVLETVIIEAGKYLGIKLPISIHQGEVEINLGKKRVDMQDLFDIELSINGEKWIKSTPIFNNTSTCKVKIPTYGTSYIRVINKSDTRQLTHLRKFTITSKQLDGANGNSSMAQDANRSEERRVGKEC